jgi:Spy/CpxP family protein refolding chaperone
LFLALGAEFGQVAVSPDRNEGMPDMLRLIGVLIALIAASPAFAQHTGSVSAHSHAQVTPAPYAGFAGRRLKALSAAQESDLRAGRGMSLALAAELNGYPGPAHVLENADALNLTHMQRAAAEALRARMAAEAQAIGARILLLEEALDALFATASADPARLTALTTELGSLGGRLRDVHLAAHIDMRAALEPQQRAAYARARGYNTSE